MKHRRSTGLRFWMLLGGIVVGTGAGGAVAPVEESPLLRYDLRVWQTDEGLPQNSVTALAQMFDGYLWVGTRAGLARFDGITFSPVDEPAAPALKAGLISALAVGTDGSLWIACGMEGVFRLNAGKFTHYLQRDGLADNQVQCILAARDGTVWFGSETGLTRFAGGRFEVVRAESLLDNNSVKAMCEEDSGIIRVATVTGLISIGPDGKVSQDNFGLGPVGGVFKSVWADRRGRLWLGATDGLVSIAGGQRGSYAADKSVLERITTALHEDSLGQLWIGSYDGLARRVNDRLMPWWVGKRTLNDLVNVILEDREKNIWLGGRDGLYRLSPARFQSFTLTEGLTANNVMSLREDRAGGMWFATWGGGLNYLREGKLAAITTANGLTHDMTLSLEESADGSLLIGMDLMGVLNRIRPGESNTLPRIPGMINAGVRVLHETPEGVIWAGTTRGLSCIRRDGETNFSVVNHTAANGLSGNDVNVILQDRAGQLWVGTEGGISRWTGDGFRNYTAAAGLPAYPINALYEAANGDLWIGTRGGGLGRWRDEKFTFYNRRHGLFSDEIYEVLEDDSGRLWMTCRQGLFQVNPQQFEALDQGRVPQISCTVYGREDGLPTVQFNGVAKPAGWKSRDGRLWFASIRGVVAVEPRVRLNNFVPQVAIAEVLVNQVSLWRATVAGHPPRAVKIPPGNGRVEIHYTALSLQAPEKNRFRYRLSGVDSEWVEAGPQRVATYNNVLPGDYRFEVLASNNDGVWNQEPATIGLSIAPHLWQTWWFRSGLVLAPLALVALVARLRVARLRALENLRIRIAADLHDDVGARLTKLAMVTELADRETKPADSAKPHIQQIASTARDITRAMDEVVWTINPRNDTLDSFANYLFHHAEEYFRDTGVRCRLDLPVVLPERKLSTEVRHNLFMAVKEALNNVLKHAAATEVRIALNITDTALSLSITDNGHGLKSGQGDPTGVGIDIMRGRMQRVGGEFLWQSGAGGTKITLVLPGHGRR